MLITCTTSIAKLIDMSTMAKTDSLALIMRLPMDVRALMRFLDHLPLIVASASKYKAKQTTRYTIDAGCMSMGAHPQGKVEPNNVCLGQYEHDAGVAWLL